MPSLRQKPAQCRDEPEAAADATLVHQAQRHPPAFAALYGRYQTPVITYCAYRLSDRAEAEAEDAASAIFIKALHHPSRFTDREDSFRTWLFRIAHNEVSDRHRHRARHPEVALRSESALPDPDLSPADVPGRGAVHLPVHETGAEMAGDPTGDGAEAPACAPNRIGDG